MNAITTHHTETETHTNTQKTVFFTTIMIMVEAIVTEEFPRFWFYPFKDLHKIKIEG